MGKGNGMEWVGKGGKRDRGIRSRRFKGIEIVVVVTFDFSFPLLSV